MSRKAVVRYIVEVDCIVDVDDKTVDRVVLVRNTITPTGKVYDIDGCEFYAQDEDTQAFRGVARTIAENENWPAWDRE